MIFSVLIKIVHFVVCIGLIVVVLLQADKGEGLAGAFGGGATGAVFGDRGSGGIMTKITTGMAIVFMFTSLTISIWLPRWSEPAAPTYNPVQTSGSTKAPIDAPAPVAPAVVHVRAVVPAAQAVQAVVHEHAGTALQGFLIV